MDDIDFLEHGGADSFQVRVNGEQVPLPDPRTQNYQWVLLCLGYGHVPSRLDDIEKFPDPLPEWKRQLVFDRWRAAWELPGFSDARRLAYLVDHYRAAISNDLHTQANLDLGELWRARRWTLILDVVDRLPSHSWYSAAVSMDEEHANMLAESLAERKPDSDNKPTGPSLTTWSPEVAALTNIYDAVRQVHHAVYAAQIGKKAGEPPKPSARPVTPLERAMVRAEHKRKQAAHEKLVARVLPHKNQG